MFKIFQASAAALATLWLIASLHRAALTVGALWLAAGLGYLLLHRRFAAAARIDIGP